ncbi:unnamed protein product [Rotaria socialis]|uniref:Uncharacterized protein n=2 Tax=Rotaria socialis TaxID=392032 RepID=A0A820K475_9BILA|nr:unnamed protein product [Rotaria socialis]
MPQIVWRRIVRAANGLFSNWRLWFNRKENGANYKKIDDDAERNDEAEPVGIQRLFRFANRTDFIMMSVALFLVLVQSICILFSLIFFGMLTGLFANQSFGNKCDQQQNNLTDLVNNNYTYHSNIDVHVVKRASLDKLSTNSYTNFLSTLPTTVTPFRDKVMKIIYWGFIIGAIEFVASSVGCFIWTLSMKRQIQRMTIALFRSFTQRKISYLDTTSAAELNGKLFDNIEKIEKGIGFELLILVATLLGFIVYIVASFIVDWKLTLIMLLLLPLIIGSSYIFSKVIASETLNELVTYSRAGKIVQEVFSSLRTVLSLNGSKFEQTRYEKELETTRWSSIRQGAVLGIFTGWLSLMAYLVYAVGFISGSLLISRNSSRSIDISDILVIVSIFAESFSFISFIGPFFQSYSEALGAAAPVFRLIDEGNDAAINESDVWRDDTDSIVNINGDVAFNDVNFVYPTRKDAPVLHNLSIRARSGQTTAIVGSSGCGKSTCLSLFLRYYEPSSGQITIDGRAITEYGVNELRKNIGVVSQEPILFGTTIYENIRYGKLNATRLEIEQAAQEANAHDFITRLPYKYETLVGERGVQLSGGEKQRIALARALVKQPTFLLLDEATSALDSASEKIVQETLNQACKGRTTIVIAHRLTTIQNADQIYVLDKGTVIEQGTHETLIAKDGGKYQSMVKSQQVERTDEDSDDMMAIETIRKQSENFLPFRHSRFISGSVTTDEDKDSSKPLKQRNVIVRLLAMNKPEWLTILVACLACIINGAAEPFLAFLLAKIVEAFKYCSNSQLRRHVLLISFIFLVMGVVLMFIRFCQYTAFAIAGSKLTQRIRSKTFTCLLRQEVAYFDRPENSSGAISTRLSSDAAAIQEMLTTRLGSVCEVLALVLFGFIFGWIINAELALIAICALVVLFISLGAEVSVRLWLSEKCDPIIESASKLVVEVIHNMRTIKQLSIEKEVLRQYSGLIKKVTILSWKPQILFSMTFGLLWILEIYTLVFLYWRALVLYERKEVTNHGIIMVLAFAIFSLQALKLIGMIAERIADSVSAAETFFDLFDRIPVIDNGSTEGQELPDFRGEIKFDEVKFIYPTRPTSTILNKLQLNIEPGQRIAVVGTSGCGKSTIVQLLERFYDTTRGQILLDGIDIRNLNIHWLRSQFGYVHQEPILFDLTIAENISYGLEDIPRQDIINAARRANVHQFIEHLPQGYETRVGMKGSFLSGGEKQRIAIARVFLRRPKVLLLDEATSAMDSQNEQIIQEALEKAHEEDPSLTSLIIAHRLSTIRSCNSICVIERGRIIESGTHAELAQQRGPYFHMLSQNHLH